MIDINDYPKFAKDIQTKQPQVEALMCLGWIERKEDTQTHVTSYTALGMPYIQEYLNDVANTGGVNYTGESHETIFIANGKQKIIATPRPGNISFEEYTANVQGNLKDMQSQYQYFTDIDLNLGTFTESLDFDDRKYKINNITAKMTNFLVDGIRMSDRLAEKNWINQKVAIFWKTPSCKDLADCFPMFIGIVRRINHTNTQITFTIEDYSENHIKKDLPNNIMPQKDYVVGKNRNLPVPIVYGNVDAVPVPFSQGEEAGAGGSSRIKLYCETKPLERDIQGTEYQIGGQTIHVSPIYVYDNDRYYNVVKKGSGLGHNNYSVQGNKVDFFVNEYDIVGEADDPIYQEGNTQEGTLLQDVLLNENQSVVSDTHINTLKLQVFQKPTNVSIQVDDTLAGTPPALEIYSNDGETQDSTARMERAFDESGDGLLLTNSFVGIRGKIAPRARGSNSGYSFGFRLQFDNADIPFSGDLLDVEGTNAQNPTETFLLIKYNHKISSKVEYSRNLAGDAVYGENNPYYFDWSNNEGVRFSNFDIDDNTQGYGVGPNFYADDRQLGAVWIDNNNSSKYFSRSLNELTADSDWYKARNIGRGFLANINNTEGTDAETNFPGGRYWERGLNNIDHDGIGMNAYNIPGNNYQTLYLGFGKQPYEPHLYNYVYDPLASGIAYYQYFFDAEMKLYNVRLYKEIRVNNLYNKNYFVRIEKGRKNTQGTTIFAHGFTWIIQNILNEELGVDGYRLNSQSYVDAISFEEEFSKEEAGFSLNEKTPAKEVVENIMKSSPFLVKCKYDGTFAYSYIKKSYSPSDVTGFIKKLDVFNYSYSQTSIKNLTTKIELYYHKDYGRDKYNAYTFDAIENYTLNNGTDIYNPNYYGLDIYNEVVGYNTHGSSTKVIESEVIRSKHIWESGYAGKQVSIEPGVHDGYATDFCKYMLLNECQQKLIINLELPLSYLWLETGDIVQFDELLDKAYSYDYSKLQAINGMWCYPAFVVTKVQKSQRKVKAVLRQLWYINDDNNHNWVEEQEDNQVYGCMIPSALNYNPNATTDNDSCYFLGDPNQDGIINVLDIIELVQFILGVNVPPGVTTFINENTPFKYKAMDLNDDGVVNVSDIIAMVNVVLDATGNNTLPGCTNELAPNYNPQAGIDDGTCQLPNYVCGNPHAVNYDESGFGFSNHYMEGMDQEWFDTAGFGGGIIDIADDAQCILPPNDYPSNMLANQISGVGSWGDSRQHTMVHQTSDWYAPYWYVADVTWWLAYHQLALLNSRNNRQVYAHHHLNTADPSLLPNDITPEFLAGRVGGEDNPIHYLNIMVDSQIATFIANSNDSNTAYHRLVYCLANRFPVGIRISAAYQMSAGWGSAQIDNEVELNRYYFYQDQQVALLEPLNTTKIKLNLDKEIAQGYFSMGVVNDDHFFEEGTDEMLSTFYQSPGDYNYFGEMFDENGANVLTASKEAILRRIVCFNGCLKSDPNGNCEGMGDHFGFYARSYLDLFNEYGGTNETANLLPPSIVFNIPIHKGSNYDLGTPQPPSLSVYAQQQYMYGGFGPNYSPSWLSNWAGYDNENIWENLVDSGFYQIEFDNVTMTDIDDKMQVMVYLNKEEYDSQHSGSTSGVGFAPSGTLNAQPTGTPIYDKTLSNSSVYDEFGNSIYTTGKFPRILLNMLEHTNSDRYKYYLYVCVIYHTANAENRLGFSPRIKRLGENFETGD